MAPLRSAHGSVRPSGTGPKSLCSLTAQRHALATLAVLHGAMAAMAIGVPPILGWFVVENPNENG